MIRSTLIAAALAAACAAPAFAAPADGRAAVLDGLDSFCRPYLAGADGAATNAAAQAAGWRPRLGQMIREGGWGRVEVMYKPGVSCVVALPRGSAGGQEAAILDAAGAWAKKNGYRLAKPRATASGSGFDTVAEDWTRPGGGNALGVRAYLNRRGGAGGLIPDVSIYIYAK